jgi:exopolysaccharide production protein ExoY
MTCETIILDPSDAMRLELGCSALHSLAKRMLDMSLALSALIVTAPLLLILCLVIRLDGGSALYAHERLGAAGKRFKCLKFRTMVPQSALALQAHLAANPAADAEWQATHKLRNDPRVTWVGRFLRKTSLDELPQLLNVLFAEMSLVGPRPITEAEVVRYGSNIQLYLSVRPGITGLWQISGRSRTSYPERVELDSRYVLNWSVQQDLLILARTIPAVLSRDGAC